MKHIPNLLTQCRLLLVPAILWLLWTHSYEFAFVLFFAAGSTDVLDGYLARRFQVTSRFGAYLDPVADKALLSGTYLVLGLDQVIERWLMVLVLGRDALILAMAGAGMAFTSLRKFPPTVWGKVNTLVQILFALTVVGHKTAWFSHWPLAGVESLLFWLTAVSTAWSGAHYIWTGVAMLRGQAGAPSQ